MAIHVHIHRHPARDNDWDESKHKRDHGKFASTGGAGAKEDGPHFKLPMKAEVEKGAAHPSGLQVHHAQSDLSQIAAIRTALRQQGYKSSGRGGRHGEVVHFYDHPDGHQVQLHHDNPKYSNWLGVTHFTKPR